MGYYTDFTLSMYGKESDINKAKEDAKNSDNGSLKELITSSCVYAKWYYYDDNMSEFAKRHPDVLFCVSGYGEESEDIWEHRFKGELSERQDAQIHIPPFTIPELKNINI